MSKRNRKRVLFCDLCDVNLELNLSISMEGSLFVYSHSLTCPICCWEMWGTSLNGSTESVFRTAKKLGARTYVITDACR